MIWRLPRLSLIALTVWRRNLLVWWRLIGPALLTNFGEPLLYLVGLGYGLGMFIGQVEGMTYLTFLASGFVASSSMNSATFEGTYSVFTRMVPQKSYEALLATPLELDDILLGEMLWCATKGAFSAVAILVVAFFLDAVASPWAVLAVPVAFLIGLAFAGPAVAVSAISPNYDFFSYYFVLLITPMFLMSGVFYPVDTLPQPLPQLVQFLPLNHAVELVRPLVAGLPVPSPWLHLGVLLVYAAVGYFLALVLTRRRLLV